MKDVCKDCLYSVVVIRDGNKFGECLVSGQLDSIADKDECDYHKEFMPEVKVYNDVH